MDRQSGEIQLFQLLGLDCQLNITQSSPNKQGQHLRLTLQHVGLLVHNTLDPDIN